MGSPAGAGDDVRAATPDVSVVIPFLDSGEMLREAVCAILAQIRTDGANAEVVLADNGSQLSTRLVADQVAQEYAEVRLVDASAQPGAGPARNAGAAVARGRMLAFTDADDIVLPGWLAAVADIAANGGQPVLATGPVVRFTTSSELTRLPSEQPSDPMRHMDHLAYADGSNFVVDKASFLEAGGFDPACRTGQDVDLSWRLQLLGIELRFDPRLRIGSRLRADMRAAFRQYLGYGTGDALLFLRHRNSGASRDRYRVILRVYAGLFLRLPFLGRRDTRDRWVRQLGRRMGRLRGSVRYRVFYL